MLHLPRGKASDVGCPAAQEAFSESFMQGIGDGSSGSDQIDGLSRVAAVIETFTVVGEGVDRVSVMIIVDRSIDRRPMPGAGKGHHRLTTIAGEPVDAVHTGNRYAAQAADDGMVKCSGINSCKGSSECKTAKSACKGHNSCKGQGWVSAKDQAECTSKGGKIAG